MCIYHYVKCIVLSLEIIYLNELERLSIFHLLINNIHHTNLSIIESKFSFKNPDLLKTLLYIITIDSKLKPFTQDEYFTKNKVIQMVYVEGSQLI